MIQIKDSTKVLITTLGLLSIVIDHRLFEVYNKIDMAHNLSSYGMATPNKYTITIWNLPAFLVVIFGITSLLLPILKRRKNHTEPNKIIEASVD
jgi:hypothetical protein